MHNLSEDARLSILRKHGGFPLAYSVAFQRGLSRFGDESGFLAYSMAGRTAFALANPLVNPSRLEPLLDEFISTKRDACFVQVSRPVAELLSKKGFHVNEMGTEATVSLPDFDFRGPARRSFRTASNRLAASGCEVRESPQEALDRQQLREVSEQWRRTRLTKHHELRFLVRPVVLSGEPDVRKFFMFDRAGRLMAFAIFDPVYENGKITGYLCTSRRWLPGSDPLAGYALLRNAIETFQKEGVATLHLGLSPFHDIHDKDFENNWLVRRLFRFAYSNALTNRWIYPFQSLTKHKQSYGGTTRQTYLAFNTLPALPRLLKLLWICRIA